MVLSVCAYRVAYISLSVRRKIKMARIECYISPTNGVRRRVGVTYTPKGFSFHKSEGKWDYAFSITHRDVMCVDYSPNEFPAS